MRSLDRTLTSLPRAHASALALSISLARCSLSNVPSAMRPSAEMALAPLTCCAAPPTAVAAEDEEHECHDDDHPHSKVEAIIGRTMHVDVACRGADRNRAETSQHHFGDRIGTVHEDAKHRRCAQARSWKP